jgi:CNT family concentrative nucleoside transporter
MERVVSFTGLLVMLMLAWLLSENRRRMNFRLIVSGVVLQFLLGLLLLKTRFGEKAFEWARLFVAKIVSFSDAGAEFVFGAEFQDHYVAFSVLPTIIFVSSATAVLFHLGILQWVVKLMAKVMVWVMDVSGAESLAASANVYVGMTESPLVIRPYLNSMTRSEIMALMTGGMATVAGGVMAVYAKFGVDAGHLMAASLMSAPASLVIAKIMVPEVEESVTKGVVRVEIPKEDANILDAACRGAAVGLKLALNVGAMLIAFIALIHCLNWMLTPTKHFYGEPLTLELLLGWVCAPLAWIMGVPWQDAPTVGALLGTKTVFNELIAYDSLVSARETLSPRSFVIATYALCGFANFGSIAIQIGGIGGLVPERRKDFAKYGLRALIGGTLAAYMTATIAGILVVPEQDVQQPPSSPRASSSPGENQHPTEEETNTMKVLGISGSPRPGGNTDILLSTALEVLDGEGIETEFFSLADRPIKPCMACSGCFRSDEIRCVQEDPAFEGMVERFTEADGILVGSPVYFGSATPQTMALLDRVGYVARANGNLLRRKVGAAIVVARRAGQNFTLAQLNYFFLISEMIVPGSTYWNIAFGREKGEVQDDTEGLETVRNLAANMAWLLKKTTT